ncbi:hypothetical protein BH11PSE7_BH11PSE7_31860 [soil metagenome]
MTQADGSAAAALNDEAQIAVLEAQAAIDAFQRVLDESGLTPEDCLEAVRNLAGEAAVATLRQDVGRTIRALDDTVDREVMHRPATNRPLSRRLANRGI